MPLSPVYAKAYQVARVVCKRLGYSLAIHGSGVQDLDLVAIPMAETLKAQSKALTEMVRLAVGGQYDPDAERPIRMKHNRVAWVIVLDEYHHLDFSVMLSEAELGAKQT